MNPQSRYDVAVVGGGPAGLSAAVVLARSLRSVVVVDDGHPRNAPAAGAHNVLGQDGVPPLELLAKGRREAEHYGAGFREDRVDTVGRAGDGFELRLASGARVLARRLVLATGLRDELPDIPGLRERWGRGVLHCPYCHGWEVRGRRIGVVGTGPLSMHQALLFRQLSEDVTLFLNGIPEPDAGELAKLAALGVRTVPGTVAEVRGPGNGVDAVVLADGGVFPVEAVAAGPRMVARAELFAQLGGTTTEHPAGRFIETGQMGQTAVPGVWAAGNAGNLSAMVVTAMAEGTAAGAALNADLVMEHAAALVA